MTGRDRWNDLSALELWKSFGVGRHSCGFAVTWSRCTPHLAVEEAEKKKLAKYKDLQQRLYLPDTQGNYVPETSTFRGELLKRAISTIYETRAQSFFVQKLSILLQQHNSACILGTLNDDSNLKKIFLI